MWSLIKRLDPKDLNIGRPSTYATIMNVIQENGYVETKTLDGIEKESIIMSWNNNIKKNNNLEIKEEKKKIMLGKESNKLVPTLIGEKVTEFLEKHFPKIMEYQFTINMEKNLDEIASGKKIWWKVVEEFYNEVDPIMKQLNSTILTIKKDNSQQTFQRNRDS